MLDNKKPPPLWNVYELYLLIAVSTLAFISLFVAFQTHPLVTFNDEESSVDLYAGVQSKMLQIQQAKSRRLPQAIIIGARKSGTRALARFLEINPAIRAAHNEVHFFDRAQNYRLGLEWYRKQMPETDEGQMTIEKSPAYLVTRNVPERIKAMDAGTKLILILRDPVTRLISDFSQLVANRLSSSLIDYDRDDYELVSVGQGFLKAASTENRTTIWQEAEKEFEDHVLRSDGGIDEQRRIVRIGMYSTHLERWLAVFPREQFHFVDGERLIKEPHVELQKLERFLGFEKPSIERGHFVFSSKKGFYCLTNRTLTRDKRQITGKNSMIDKDGPLCLGKSKGRRHVNVSDKLVAKLKDFYTPYNEYLNSLTGLNFSNKV